MEAINAIVRGRVQGVGFRYSTQKKAEQLQLRGWVRNLSNGNVEVVAEGEKDSLEDFLTWLKSGPSGARVVDVEVSYQLAMGLYRNFSIEF